MVGEEKRVLEGFWEGYLEKKIWSMWGLIIIGRDGVMLCLVVKWNEEWKMKWNEWKMFIGIFLI